MRRLNGIVVLVVLVAVVLFVAPVWAQRGDDSDRLSKNGKTQGVVDGVEITVEYGRPSVKGRKIWGGLVPFDRVWRTGADEATTITLAADASIEGQALAAGMYSFFTVPSEGEWTVIFNEVSEQWGAFNYEEAKDVLRVTVTPQASEFVESLEFQMDESDLILRWGELAVPIQIAASQ